MPSVGGVMITITIFGNALDRGIANGRWYRNHGGDEFFAAQTLAGGRDQAVSSRHFPNLAGRP